MPKTKVFWCQCGPRGSNFGDEASETIVRLVGGRETEHIDVPHQDSADIVASGSVLHLLSSDYKGYIWGSGIIQDDHQFRFPNAKIQAVRGKLTAKRAGVDVPLGDPLLLWQGVKRPKWRLGIIPHYVDFEDRAIYEFAKNNESVIVVDMLARDAADRIATCSCILSSALHGLVIADAMGIPNLWTLFSDNKIVGHGFKFRDYYSAFDIDDPLPFRFESDRSLNDLTHMIEDRWKPRPLQRVQMGLLDAFPRDLLADETPLWEERAKVVAMLISKDASVLDLGAGTQILRRYVGPDYRPCDALKTSEDTLVCDFNLDQYPDTDRKYDYVVVNGVIEYIAAPFLFLSKAMTYGEKLVLTYAQKLPNQSVQSRRMSGWINHLTQDELEGTLNKMGVHWSLETMWNEQLVYVLGGQ
jgi:hypothetical protein